MILLVLIIFLLLYLALLFGDKQKTVVKVGRVLFSVFMVISDLLFSYVGFILGLMMGSLVYAALFVIGMQLVSIWIIASLFGAFRHKRFKQIMIVLSVVFGVFLSGVMIKNAYVRSLPVLHEPNQYELQLYYPYREDNRLVVLDEAATLQLDDNLPVLDGATALYPVYAAFAKAVYPADALTEENTKEVLRCSTTSGAYRAIVDGEADIVFCADPSQEQMEYAKAQGVELIYTPIGYEAFVFLVNARNPIDSLTVDEVRSIYSGNITAWKDLGVRGIGDIRAFQRESGSGSQSALLRLMGDTEVMQPTETEEIAEMSGTYTAISDYRNHRNAIGYSFRFYTTQMMGGDKVKLLSLNGIAPTKANIANGTYPVVGNFYAITRSDASKEVKVFVDWMLSEQGQYLVDETGYVAME